MRKLLYFFVGSALLITSCKNEKKDADSTEEVAEVETAVPYGGLALYSVRDSMQNDPKGVLKQVAEMGYAYVEAAGYQDGKYYGMEPAAFKSFLDSIGLKPMSTHQSAITLDNADQMFADAKTAGFKYLVVPIPPMGHFTYDPESQTMGMSGTVEEVTEILNVLGEKAHAAGIQLLYHNHDFEFKANEDGVVPIEYFIENTNPEHVNFQMDLYWVTKAGADPIAYFEKAPGRFKAWHVKDMDTEGRFAPVGQGTIDFSKILAKKDQSGMQVYFVEQDVTFERAPLDAVALSREGLEKHGFDKAFAQN